MKSLLKRSIVAVIGIPFTLWVIWSGGVVMAIVMGIIAGAAAYELVKLANRLPVIATPWKAVIFSAAAPFVALFFGTSGLLILLIASFLVVSISSLRHETAVGFTNLSLNLSAVVYVGISISTFLLIRENASFDRSTDLWIIFFVMIGVWIADTAAYSFGSLFGKRPLAKKLSPNKTIEGTVAAILVAIIWAYIAPKMPDDLLGVADRLVMGALMGSMAVLGDLSESMMKRAVGVKDSGNIFPGHGGMLDRFDSLMGAMPAIYLYLVLRGILAF